MFGAGLNIDFELALLDHTACDVFVFDMNPKAAKFIEGVERARGSDRLHVFPIGLRGHSTEHFFSKCRAELSGDDTTTTGAWDQLATLHEIMVSLGHDRIDLLKMDIEGWELGVLPQASDPALGVEQLLVELHAHPSGSSEITQAVLDLVHAGFLPFWTQDMVYAVPDHQGPSIAKCDGPLRWTSEYVPNAIMGLMTWGFVRREANETWS